MSELTCGGDWLVAYADDELTGDDRQEAAEHVATCAHCQQECASLRSSLLQVQSQWHLPQPVKAVRRSVLMGRVSVLARAAVVAAVVLTLAWQLTTRRDPAVVLAPAMSELDSDAAIHDWLQRETQIARLRAASELLVQEPGMQERGEQLGQYLSRTYGN
ncbi:anti-sigma factor family protein [Anatilimnocola floriformis]|uniref:anti-sigma factor family protein n=1 Tax=Anatilimnocola floriformis TaxID=2948575 RepID=UPI0020C56044|nr:zf-HC2 domain-containing protein [Anatilimnocola floriformis]